MAIILVDNTPVELQTEFAVDMTCQNCVNAVQKSLQDLQGIERYDIDLAGKRVTITGKTPPSRLFAALKSTNRQVIVRGASSTSPTPYPTAAAVSILESPLPLPASIARTSFPALASTASSPAEPLTHTRDLPGLAEDEFSQKVFGICRFVQIAPKTILMDLTVRLPPPAAVGLHAGERAFEVYISSTGNMVDPPRTTGGAMVSLGKIEPDKDGYGDMFREVSGELWEWVGRGCVVQAAAGGVAAGEVGGGSGAEGAAGTGRIFAGVVARSAGAWGNEKTVCACSGRTMWEEGREMQAKSAL